MHFWSWTENNHSFPRRKWSFLESQWNGERYQIAAVMCELSNVRSPNGQQTHMLLQVLWSALQFVSKEGEGKKGKERKKKRFEERVQHHIRFQKCIWRSKRGKNLAFKSRHFLFQKSLSFYSALRTETTLKIFYCIIYCSTLRIHVLQNVWENIHGLRMFFFFPLCSNSTDF